MSFTGSTRINELMKKKIPSGQVKVTPDYILVFK